MAAPLGYTGEVVAAASALTVAITAVSSSGPIPWNFQAHVGSSTGTGLTNPVTQPEFAWDLSAIARADTFTHPVYGDTFAIATDQKGHCAGCVCTTSGNAVCAGRVWNGTAYVVNSTTSAVTASARAGSAMYFDSVGGLDGNDGLTTGTPKQTAAAIKTFLTGGGGRIAYLKYGSSWASLSDAGGSWLAPTAGSSGGIAAYGTPGALPILQADAANTGGLLIDMSSTRPSDFYLQNITLDGNGKSDAINVSGGSTAHTGFLADGCTFKNPDTSIASLSLCGWNNVNFARGMWYNCSFDRGTADKVAHYCYGAGPSAFIGCSWSNGGTTPTHDVYHLHCTAGFLWLLNQRTNQPAAAGNNRNHLKLAAGQTDGEEPVCTNECISDSLFTAMPACLAIAGGDSSNPDPGGDGTHTNCVIQRCAFIIQNFGLKLGIHFSNLTTGGVLRDCLVAGTTANTDVQYLLRLSNFPALRIYRNRFYNSDNNGNMAIKLDELDPPAGGTAVLWYENAMEKVDATTAFFYVDDDALAACTFGPGNTYWARGSNPWFAWHSGTSTLYRPLSQWQTLTGQDADASYTNGASSWVDPANGVFDVKALAVQKNDGFTAVGDGGTIALGSISAGSTQSLRLFNTGRKQNLTISSIGNSGGITPVSTPTSIKNPHVPALATFTADSGTGTTLTINNDGPVPAQTVAFTWTISGGGSPGRSSGPGRPTGTRTGRIRRTGRC